MRVASLLSSATEMVCGLGGTDQLVAISHECDFPAEIINLPRVTRSIIDSSAPSAEIDQEVRQRLRDELPLYEIDEALLASLKPDVILTQAQCDVCAIRLEDVHRFVKKFAAGAGPQVVSLSPTTLEDVLADVQAVASVMGMTEQAHRYLAELNRRIETVQERAYRFEGRGRPRVVCVEWTEPLMIAGNWTPELIERAGGMNGLSTLGMHSPTVDWLDVYAFDPDVVLIAPCGFGLVRSQEEVKPLLAKGHLQRLRAMKERRVFVLDGNALFNRSGPRLVETLEVISDLLHGASDGIQLASKTWYESA
ncbi:MAG: cobalamin-binding protein [Planctomycetaceae bacterium]